MEGEILEIYAISYLNYSEPKLCITFIDNNLNFYNINKKTKGIVTLAIQNGWRDDWLKSYNYKTDFSVDHMLVFNKWVGDYYKNYINGKITCIGSLKNNAMKIGGKSLKDSIVYISTFIAVKPNEQSLEINGVKVLYEDFIQSEIILLGYLKEWCKDHGLVLRVSGCIVGGSIEERAFYEKWLGNINWIYEARSHAYSTYELINSAEIVISIDSTMGYECFARGVKTGFFSYRGAFINRTDRSFGWPAKLSSNGPFWTDCPGKEEFQRIMSYLNTVSPNCWDQVQKQYSADLMEFDPGNTIFKGLLKKLL